MRTAVSSFDPLVEQRLTEARARVLRAPVGRERVVRGLVAVLFLSSALSLALLAHTDRHPAWWLYGAFAVAFALASSLGFEVGAGEALPTELVLVPMLFVLPAPLVPLIVLAGLALAAGRQVVARELSLRRALVWAPVGSVFALGPAGVFVLAGEPLADTRGAVVLAIALAVQFALDSAASCTLEGLAAGLSPRELLGPLRWTFTIDALLAPIGYLAAVGARVEEGALLLSVPIVGLLALFARERRERIDSVLELSTAYRGTAFLLGDVVEAEDAYTGEHSRQVLTLVLHVADHMQLDPHTRRLAEFAALLHDVGKIRIPAEIITKPGPLSPRERALMNTHTIEGERLLHRVGGLLGDVGRIVRSCHERWDGSGYPEGLAGEQIPLVARIVCCCDAYSAMTTDRPYRRALSPQAAVAELIANRGTQFDPQVVDVLVAIAAREVEPGTERSQLGLLACPRCGRHTLLDEPVQQTNRLCLGCGLVPIRQAA